MKHESLPQLTWLRGIAALLVLFSHICRANETSYSGEQQQHFWLLNWLDLGSFGVALFFTLSGCTLYLSSSRQGFHCAQHWFVFYLRRFFRIWPAFAIALVVYLVAGIVLEQALLPYHHSWLAAPFLKPFTATDIITYLSMVFNFTGPAGLFNTAFWSLPIEFQYYLILPLLVILVQRWGPMALILVIALSHLLFKADFSSIDNSLVFRLCFTFCLGVYAGYLYQHSSSRLSIIVTLPVLTLLLVFVYLFSENSFVAYPLPSEWVIYGFVAVCCVLLVVMTPMTLPAPVANLLDFYGNISYSLYLFHNLIIALVVVVFVQFSAVLTTYKLLFLTVFSTIGATILAWVSYKYIELPSIKLGRHLSERLQQPGSNRKN